MYKHLYTIACFRRGATGVNLTAALAKVVGTMTWSGCEETVWWLTRALKNPDLQARLRELRASGAPPLAYSSAILASLDADVVEMARQELAELPMNTAITLIEAWAMADLGGREFRIESVRPASPLSYARARRVTLAVSSDENAVVASLAHVASRHAEWYQARATDLKV